MAPSRGIFRFGALALADQGANSAANLVTTVLLARGLDRSSFGVFTLAYTGLLFANGFQGALFTQPHNVLGPARHGEDYDRYTGSTAVGQAVFIVVVAVLVLAAAGFAAWVDRPLVPVLVALAGAVVAFQAQEFVRRVFYTEGRIGAALANDVVSYGGQAVVVALIWHAGALSSATALWALAATSAVAAVWGGFVLRSRLFTGFDPVHARENWAFGKWLVGAATAYWFSSQIYLFLAAIVLGTAASGSLRAALTVLGPLNVVLMFIETAMPVRLARAREEGGDAALHHQLRLSFGMTIPLVASYCILAALAAHELLRVVVGSKYAGDGNLVLGLAVYYLVSYVARMFSAAVRAQHRTQAVFRAYLYGVVFALTIGWVLVAEVGTTGAVLGFIASAAISGAVQIRTYLSPAPVGPAVGGAPG